MSDRQIVTGKYQFSGQDTLLGKSPFFPFFPDGWDHEGATFMVQLCARAKPNATALLTVVHSLL